MYRTPGTRYNDFQNEASNLGICLQKPFHASYAALAARLKSFQTWQKSTPRPVDLAEAGFYFTGTEDIVQCFYCGLQLRQWNLFDYPWVERARHGKDCPHVLNVKGRDFYKSFNETESDSSNHSIYDVKQPSLYTDDLIYTTAAQALLSMQCYKEEDIKRAIREYVTGKGTLEFSAFDIAMLL